MLASSIVDFQSAAGETRHEYWMNRTWPFFRDVWPKSAEKRSAEVAQSLARLCIAAGSAFNHAFEQLRDWLIKGDNSGLAVAELQTSGLCTTFPDTALAFLAAIIDESYWVTDALSECLAQIRSANPQLVATALFAHLEMFLKARGRM